MSEASRNELRPEIPESNGVYATEIELRALRELGRMLREAPRTLVCSGISETLRRQIQWAERYGEMKRRDEIGPHRWRIDSQTPNVWSCRHCGRTVPREEPRPRRRPESNEPK